MDDSGLSVLGHDGNEAVVETGDVKLVGSEGVEEGGRRGRPEGVELEEGHERYRD